MHDPALDNAPLGHETTYPDAYDAKLLFPIDRATNRAALAIPTTWHGDDIWNAYELSWLTPKGKPVVALARFTFPHTSPRLVESKSFKLYLNSFSEERFEHAETISQILKTDLGLAVGAEVGVDLQPLAQQLPLQHGPMDGINI